MKCTDKSLDLLEGLYNMCFISLDALEAIPVSFTCAVTPVIVTSLECQAQNMSVQDHFYIVTRGSSSLVAVSQ